MPDITMDMSELREFTVQLDKAAHFAKAKTRPVIQKAGVNMKRQMQAEAAKSRHFRIARHISYDTINDGMGVEVGPEKTGAGNLANIAYFGGVHGGGGTLPDPGNALRDELPNVTKWLEGLIVEVLHG